MSGNNPNATPGVYVIQTVPVRAIANNRPFVLPKKKILTLSFLQIIASLITIISQFFVDYGRSGVGYFGMGILCGVIFAITSAIGVIAAVKNSRCGAILFLLMSIVCIFFCIPLVILPVLGMIESNQDNSNYGPYNANAKSNDYNITQERRLHLVGGNSSSEGNVISFNPRTGIEGPVCDDGWDLKDATVICRQLGFINAITATSESYFGSVSTRFSFTNVDCRGNESTFEDCRRFSYTGGCSESEGAGVICHSNSSTSVVYLSGGSSRGQGNVFAYNPTSGVVGPVCDDYWDISDATVVCKQLGYTDAARFTTGSSFGLVSGNFSYVNVHCSGYEKNIDQCPHSNSHNCDPYSGAGVVCTTTSTTTTIKTSTTQRPYSSTTPRDSVYLSGGSSSHGNVFAYNPLTGVTGPVCYSSWDWDLNDAGVVCRQLGFEKGAIRASTGTYYTGDDFSYYQLQCDGSESTIQECNHYSSSGICTSSRAAAVTCNTVIPPEVELIGGDDYMSGNVFAMNPSTGTYGPVCDTYWGMEEAKVVCKQLGFPYAEMATTSSYFGAASPPFSYLHVACNGYEYKLDYCSHGFASCYGKYEAAGVRCSYNTFPDSDSDSSNVAIFSIHIIIAIFISFLSLWSSVIVCNALNKSKRALRAQGMVTRPPPNIPYQMSPSLPIQNGAYSGTTFPDFDQPPPSYESIATIGKSEEQRNISS